MAHDDPQGASWPGHGFALGFAGFALVVVLILMAVSMRAAALPGEASGKMLAVFEPTMAQDKILIALTNAGGRPIRPTWLGFVWVVSGDTAGFAGRLKRHGAIGAYAELPFSPQLAGCFAFVDAKTMKLFNLR